MVVREAQCQRNDKLEGGHDRDGDAPRHAVAERTEAVSRKHAEDERQRQRRHPQQRRERFDGDQPHPAVAPGGDRARMLVENLALTARPARALCPQCAQRRWDLHPDQRLRLVRGVPAGHQQPPGEVDVLRRHPGVVAADRQHPLAPEHPEHPGGDAHPARQRLRAPDQADDRRRLQHLHRADQPRAVGDVRRARHRRHQRGLVHPRRQVAQGVRQHVSVGVGDYDEFVAGPGEPGVELLGLAAVDWIAQYLAARVPGGCRSRRRRRCDRSSRRRARAARSRGSRRRAPPGRWWRSPVPRCRRGSARSPPASRRPGRAPRRDRRIAGTARRRRSRPPR